MSDGYMVPPILAADLERTRQEIMRLYGLPPKLLTPLPRRVRLRLWLMSRRDRTAIWLVEHVHWRAGMWAWRLTGGWR